VLRQGLAKEGMLVPTIETVVFWLVIVVAAFLLWQSVKTKAPEQQTPEISYSAFLAQVEAGNVGKVNITGDQILATYKDGSSVRVIGPSSQEGTLKSLREKNVEIWFHDASGGSLTTSVLNLAPLVPLAALWFFMIRQMKRRQSSAYRESQS